MAAIDTNSNATLLGLGRYINCLGEDNKMARKKAIEGLRKDTIQKKPPLEPSEMALIFNEILKPLLKVFSDPGERCREIAIGMVTEFLKQVPKPHDHLPYIVPVLVQRLGQQEIVEPSEELRLLLVQLFHEIVKTSGKHLGVYADDASKILQRTIVDPFPDVKRESCYCASATAKSIPEFFHMHVEQLIKPLLLTLTHQHAKTRATVVETIGTVIMYGTGKEVENVVSHLAQRLFDQSPVVRKAVIQVVGEWLLDLRDRYSFHHKLIPLLLTGITDDQPEIQELASCLWHDVGTKFERENEEDLKDKMDFPKPDPKHYPPNVERPNLGCRDLLARHVSKIIPGLMKDVTDWVVETRLVSASLLYTLLLNTEDNMTQHVEMILSGMYRACADDNPKVVWDIKRSAELVGYFVGPEVWCKMILGSLKMSQSPGNLMVLASVIRGSDPKSLQPFLPSICDALASPDTCHTVQTAMHEQLLGCCGALVEVLGAACDSVSQTLFTLLLTVLSLAQDDSVREEANAVLDKLGQALGLEGREQLYSRHAPQVLSQLQDSLPAWTSHSVEHHVFSTLLLQSGSVVGELLDTIIPMLVVNLEPERDPEMRLRLFSLLSKLLLSAGQTLDSASHFGDHAVTVLKDMVLPNCVWRAGRTAGAIRTTAVSCLWVLLQSGALTKERLKPEVEQLLTQVLSTLEDDNKSTRLVSCRVLTRVFDALGPELDRDRLHNLYPELIKRLDDSSDEIRITVSKTFQAYFSCFKGGYDVGLYRAHLEALYKGLLIHLDDPDEKIQLAILEVLKEAGKLSPPTLLAEVETARHKHRTPRFCDELSKFLQTLPQSNS